MGRGPDSQRDALYAAEREFCRPPHASLSRAQARSLVAEVCQCYGLPRIRLAVGHRVGMTQSTWAWANYPDREIVFQRRTSLSPIVLLHELAHIVVQHYWQPRRAAEDHGREFCGVLMYLFARHYVMPADALAVIFRRHGVKYRPVRFCTPKALARRRA